MKSRVSKAPPFKLAVRYLSLVNAAVTRARRQVATPADWNNLLAISALALQDAASRYGPSEPVRFAAYAKCHVRGAILDGLSKQSSASRRPRLQQAHKAIQSPVWTSGSTPTQADPGDEFSAMLLPLRKVLEDARYIHETSRAPE